MIGFPVHGEIHCIFQRRQTVVSALENQLSSLVKSFLTKRTNSNQIQMATTSQKL